jgi:APA family basic amino acid/polyamine antiporter
VALVLSGVMASIAILGSHLAGDFFLGVDILVTSMLVNFMLMCVTVITLPGHNPEIAKDVTVLPNRSLQVPLAGAGFVLLGVFLVVHVMKDLNADVEAWYLHSTVLWVGVMALASVIYFNELATLKKNGVDTDAHFLALPPE